MKRIEYIFLFFILIAAFCARLYRFDGPIGGWHSWRQADTSAVSRNFIKYGFDILHPRYDDLSKTASGLDNPHGYRFVEFPIYNLSQAGLYKVFGTLTLEEWGRMVSIFSSLGSILFLYLIIKKHSNSSIALFSASFFAFIPFNIYYGRTILPDESMVMAILGGTWFFDLWIEKNAKFDPFDKLRMSMQSSKLQFKIKNYYSLFLSILFTAIALLLKPYALFFMLPMFYLAIQKYGKRIFLIKSLWIFIVCSLLPLILWRMWMRQYPEGIAASPWLFNGNGIRFHPAFFRWILYERMGKLILGFFGAPIFLYGFFAKIKAKKYWFFYSFLLASAVYIVVFATGNVQHDYYQILIMPSVAIFYGLGAYFLINTSFGFINKTMMKVLVIILSIGMLWVTWYMVRDYFNINHPEIVEAGAAVDQLTPKDAKIIAPYGGDTAFLYQTNRQGWPVVDRSFDDFKKAGATHMVFVDPGPRRLHFAYDYRVVKRTKNYIIFDLTKTP